MSATSFTATNRGDLVARAAAGASLADSCRAIGLRLNTVKAWISRGRRESEGPYFAFVADLDAARRVASERPEPMSAEQFRGHLDGAVRAGSVAAMKLWSSLYLDDPPEEVMADDDPLSELDDLARLRRAV